MIFNHWIFPWANKHMWLLDQFAMPNTPFCFIMFHQIWPREKTSPFVAIDDKHVDSIAQVLTHPKKRAGIKPIGATAQVLKWRSPKIIRSIFLHHKPSILEYHHLWKPQLILPGAAFLPFFPLSSQPCALTVTYRDIVTWSMFSPLDSNLYLKIASLSFWAMIPEKIIWFQSLLIFFPEIPKKKNIWGFP